jgi:hypothetical protein
MSVERKSILGWETAGFLFTVALGSVLHFAFEWSGYWPPLALFAAVNESTWEHLKLAFWPALLFALIELPALRNRVRNFWAAKTLGLLTTPVLIVALFYAYSAILGRHSLLMDIAIFVLAVGLGHLVSYRAMARRPFGSRGRRILAVVLAAMVAAFALLTYLAPSFILFEDPATGQYGILDEYGDHDHEGEHGGSDEHQ